MNAHVGPAQTLKFRAQSLLAYVLEPVQPLPEWFTALDGWLARSPTFFIARPVILDMVALDITLKEYRDLLNGLARRLGQGYAARRTSTADWSDRTCLRSFPGRPIDPLTTLPRGRASTSEKKTLRPSRKPRLKGPEFIGRGRQRALRPDDHASSGRRNNHWPCVASGAEIVAGGSVHILWSAARPG